MSPVVMKWLLACVNQGCGVGGFWVGLRKFNWIIFYIALLSYGPVERQYNLLWNFYWNNSCTCLFL